MKWQDVLGLVGFLGVLFAAIKPMEGALVVQTDFGTVHTTGALSGYTTDGADMVGMSVTAFFGAASQTVGWSATGSSSGHALGSGWVLSESGDTFGGIWTLTNNTGQTMTGLVIDARPGDTMFDVAIDASGNILPGGSNSVFGTDGSARGWTFQISSAPSNLDIVATYRNIVALSGNSPIGDLWTRLDLTFSSSIGGLGNGSQLWFISDTDNAQSAGDINPIPEPGSIIIWGFAVVGFVLGTRVRTQQKAT